MKFFLKLLLTWILNLLIGSFILVLTYKTLEGNFWNYSLFKSVKSFFGDVFMYLTVAGFLSFWMFLILYFTHFLSQRMKRNPHLPMVVVYWSGVLVYVCLLAAEKEIYVYPIPYYLLVGIFLFYRILRVKLWKFT